MKTNRVEKANQPAGKESGQVGIGVATGLTELTEEDLESVTGGTSNADPEPFPYH